MFQFLLICSFFKMINEDYSKIGKIFVFPFAFLWSIIWLVGGFIEFLFIDIPAYLLNLCKKNKINNFFEFVLYYFD